METLGNEEFHPVHAFYIFKKKSINSILNMSIDEKIKLKHESINHNNTRIKLSGNNYKTTAKIDKKNKFWFKVTMPVYTSDLQYCFLRIFAYREQFFLGEKHQEAFSYTTIIFQNKENDLLQIAKDDHLFL